jgi:hypothetical protein
MTAGSGAEREVGSGCGGDDGGGGTGSGKDCAGGAVLGLGTLAQPLATAAQNASASHFPVSIR